MRNEQKKPKKTIVCQTTDMSEKRLPTKYAAEKNSRNTIKALNIFLIFKIFIQYQIQPVFSFMCDFSKSAYYLHIHSYVK